MTGWEHAPRRIRSADRRRGDGHRHVLCASPSDFARPRPHQARRLLRAKDGKGLGFALFSPGEDVVRYLNERLQAVVSSNHETPESWAAIRAKEESLAPQPPPPPPQNKPRLRPPAAPEALDLPKPLTLSEILRRAEERVKAHGTTLVPPPHKSTVTELFLHHDLVNPRNRWSLKRKR